jgi:hypothetical protein
MRRGFLSMVIGCLVLTACDERQEATPTDPNLAAAKPPAPSSTDCSFDAVKSLINSYFPPPDQQTAQGFASAMETGGAQSAAAVTNGFAIMDLIGKASRSYAPSATVGSDLTKAVTKCMFDASTEEYTGLADGDGLDAVRFDKALLPSEGGVYYVVGADYDSPDVRTLSGKVSPFGRLSAVAPGPAVNTSPLTLGNWTDALSVNTANNQGGRALIFGYPVSFGTGNDLVFEWAAIAPFTSFKDYAVISMCDGLTDQNLMVHETGIGVLAYTDVNLCGLPDASGTTKTGFRSNFSNDPVDDLSLEVISKETSPIKAGSANVQEFVIRATTTIAGETEPQGVNNVCISVTGSINNGQNLGLINVAGGECPGQTNNTDNIVTAVTDSDPERDFKAGYAKFQFYVNKTGQLILTFDANTNAVPGRTIADAEPLVLRYNVKP